MFELTSLIDVYPSQGLALTWEEQNKQFNTLKKISLFLTQNLIYSMCSTKTA